MGLSIFRFLIANNRYCDSKGYLKLAFALAGVFLFVSCGSDSTTTPEKSLKETAKEAYVYALPAVEHNKLLSRTFNNGHLNLIFGSGDLADANSQGVGPNIDTLYTTGILDIRDEPVVISVPKIEESRYVSIQLLDIFTNSEYLGSVSDRTDGNYLIAREDWAGTVPNGVKEVIKLPTSVVLALGRIQVFDPDNDNTAKSLATNETAFKIQKLSEFTNTVTVTPPSEPLEWNVPYHEVRNATASTEEFFRVFNYIVQYQLLSDKDKEVLKGFEKLHLGAGKEFNKTDFSEEEWAQIEEGVNEAKNEISSQEQYLSAADANGWIRSPDNAARWGEDYLTRAQAAWFAPHINTIKEAVYLISVSDSQGNLYSGSNNYTITFDKGDIPIVKYFWSITLYRANGTFFPNSPLNRYGIRSIDDIEKEADGSFTLYIQNENPGGNKEKNWIPAPKVGFSLSFRIYGETTKTVLPPLLKQD